MDNIGDIVKDVIGKMAGTSPQSAQKIQEAWGKVLEEKELKHTRLVGVKDGKILACVDSPAWLYQMNIRKRKILTDLKKNLIEIKGIYFKVGKV